MGLSATHLLLLLVVVVLLFGRNKISDLMGDVAKGIKSFKKGIADDDEPAKAPPAAPEVPRPLPHQTSSAPEAEKKPV